MKRSARIDITEASPELKTFRNAEGYSLIEVLIAISILAVGLLAVAAMQVSAIRVNSTATNITERATIAQDQLEQLVALPFDSTWLEVAGNPPTLDSAGNTHRAIVNDYTVEWNVVDKQDAGGTVTSKVITVTATKSGSSTRVTYVKPLVAD